MRSVFVGRNVRQNVLLFGRMFVEHFLGFFNQSETSVIDQLLGDYWRYFAPPFEYNGFYRLEPPTYFPQTANMKGSSQPNLLILLRSKPFKYGLLGIILFYAGLLAVFCPPFEYNSLYRPV